MFYKSPKIANHWFSLSQICCSKNQLREAIDFYNKGIDQLEKSSTSIDKSDRFKENAKQLYTVSSWNFGCQLIRQGEFNLGWKLFEHGLRTPADGVQRWQRALYKPFSFNKICL